MTRTVLVFGGSGFIGTHCVRRLRAAGDHVISADLLPPREKLEGVEYRIADVRGLDGFECGRTVSTLFNFAAVHTTPGHADHEYYDTNVGGALEVTRLAARASIKEIVFTSSISVYGPSEDVKDEASLPKPTSAYGRSKRFAEQIHRDWLEGAEDRRLTIVRPAVVFGAGERGNFTRMAALLRRGAFVFPGRRDTVKACIFVEDLLEAIDFARGQGQRFILFNGAYPQRYRLHQLVGTLRDRYFPSARLIDLPLPFVIFAARALAALGASNIGFHPDRVLKLIRSTDVVPAWLTSQGFSFPYVLEQAFDRWAEETDGRFD